MKTLLGLALAALVVATAEGARADGADPSAECASCHTAIAAEWEGSSHHRAATNAAYVTQLAREPLPFCRGCHAPSADASRPTPAALAARGIGCIDCHTGIAAAAGQLGHGTAPPKARACAGCHEFTFPNGTDLMQKTATEHRASAYATTACASCHLPPRNGHVDHSFAVTPLVEKAIKVDVTRAGPNRLAFRLAPGTVGHAFPTGDLFRRLAIRVRDEDGNRVAERFLGREFRSSVLPDGTQTRIEVRDERVGAGLAPCFELAAPAGSARVEIALERVDEPSVSGHAPLVRSRTIAWQGVIPVDAKEQSCR